MSLPFTAPALELPASDVAVVIPSRRLLGSGFGPTIDAHTSVVRFNDFITEGFEGDVGIKTDVAFCNSNYLRSELIDGVSYVFVTGADCEAFYDLQASRSRVCRFETERFKSRYELAKFPTAGLCAILALVESGVSPVVYGYNLTDDLYDYYHKDITQSVVETAKQGWHDLELERRIVGSLLSQKLITCK